MESFFGSLKTEWTDGKDYATGQSHLKGANRVKC